MQPLTDEQKQKVTEWIQAGAKLSEIQERLDKELDVRLTYMDVRLLADDLKLTPKDPEVAAPPVPEAVAAPEAAPALPAEGAPAGSAISLTVDQVTRPGALVSGKVTFSDAQTADWYLDQYGRLGLLPVQESYRPSPEDLAQFQASLDRELQKLGL